ncbi:MAG: hypothetical protein RI894_106, partial [Bacteroidota bacterium]
MSKFFKSNKTKAIPLSNKIYMAEWMLQRPYEKSSAYDECYVHVCNQILPIARNLIDMGAYRMSETSIETSKSLTFVLASYLEDFVSEIGLWKAFTDENKQLYGLVLPLIPLRKDYDEDDVNVEDIQYILWQFFIRATDDSLIVDPKDVNLAIFAQQIHQIFIAAIDNGKVYQTDFYKTFFRIDDKVSLINIKNQLYWIAMNSFLFTQDFSLLYKKKKEELEKKALAKTGIQIPLHLLIYAELN